MDRNVRNDDGLRLLTFSRKLIDRFVYFAVLYMDNIPLYIAVVASLAIALLIAVLVQTVIVPWMRKKITRETGGGKAKFTFGDSDGE